MTVLFECAKKYMQDMVEVVDSETKLGSCDAFVRFVAPAYVGPDLTWTDLYSVYVWRFDRADSDFLLLGPSLPSDKYAEEYEVVIAPGARGEAVLCLIVSGEVVVGALAPDDPADGVALIRLTCACTRV